MSVSDFGIDTLDRRIVHALGVDGRLGFRRLADVLGVGEHTVARRYRRLVETGVLRVVAVAAPRPDDLGQQLRLHVQPGSATQLAEALARRPDVAWVRIAGTGAEVACGIRARSASDRDRLVLDQLPHTGRVTRVVAHQMLHHFRRPGHADWEGFDDPLTPHEREALRPDDEARANGALDEHDRPLLEALWLDARRTASAVAVETGLPASTVRRRVEGLFESGAVQVDLDVDAAALGSPVAATLYVDVAPAHLDAAGRTMTAHRPTTFVAAVTGPCNLIAAVASPSVSALYDYVVTELAQVPGVRHVETSMSGEFLKRARTGRPATGRSR